MRRVHGNAETCTAGTLGTPATTLWLFPSRPDQIRQRSTPKVRLCDGKVWKAKPSRKGAAWAVHTVTQSVWGSVHQVVGFGADLASFTMLRPALLLFVVMATALLLPACKREAEATRYDLERFAAKAEDEQAKLAIDIHRYAKSNGLLVTPLQLDAEHFLDWRKREWWNLQDEYAYLMIHEWHQVEQLSRDSADFYGYEVKNFPKAKQDVYEFFAKADPEWRSLVQDAAIFVEAERAQSPLLRADLREFYERSKWESANLKADVSGFLEWREREYRKLGKDFKDFVGQAAIERDRLARDIASFRAYAAVEGERLQADLHHFSSQERQYVPRLVDDVWRFSEFTDREWMRLRSDVNHQVAMTRWEATRLAEEATRFTRDEFEAIPMLMLEVEDFFAVYEREQRPLGIETQRFWRQEIAAGHLATADLKRFYTHTDEERAELEQDMVRFVTYSRVEWRDFKRKMHNLLDWNAPFDGPSSGLGSPSVFNDFAPVDGYVKER